MNKKHSISSLINMLYILYVMYFVNTMSIAKDMGIFSEENQLTKLIPTIIQEGNFTISQGLFYYIFLGFICFAVINVSRDMDIDLYLDEYNKKIKIVNSKLFKYKVFLAINILFSIYLIINTMTLELLNSCILMNIASGFICYGKSIYFKSYICNRRLDWLKKTSQIDVNEYVDTKGWRRKIWFNGRESVSFKYRINKIIISGFVLFICSLMFLQLILSKSFMSIIFLYFMIRHLLIIIEAVFGLYTLTSGKCTGIIEKTRSRRRYGGIRVLGIPIFFETTRNYYQIVLTDYNKRREIEILSNEYCGLSEMDTMEVIHGIFSKEAITVNMIPTERITTKKIIFNFITRLIPFIIIVSIFYNSYREYKAYNSDYTYGGNSNYEEVYNHDGVTPIHDDDYNYEEDDPYLRQQRIENTKEILPKDKKYYKQIINLNEEKSTENVDVKIEKLYLGRENSKLQFRIKNKTDVALVMNVSYETHIYDKNNKKNSNILLPNEEYYCEMDIFEPSKNAKNLNVSLEYTLSPYVMHEYMDYFYYLYYPLNVVDCSSKISIDLPNKKCNIEINEYGDFYNISDDIVVFE